MAIFNHLRIVLALAATVMSFGLGCSPSRVTVLPPESYRYLREDRVLLTTRDTVELAPFDTAAFPPIRARLVNSDVRQATARGDSLQFRVARLSGVVALADVARVEFYGVFDPGLGLISDREIAENARTVPRSTGFKYGLVGGILGLLIGLASEGDSGDATVALVSTGALGGYVFGHRQGRKQAAKEALETLRLRNNRESEIDTR